MPIKNITCVATLDTRCRHIAIANVHLPRICQPRNRVTAACM